MTTPASPPSKLFPYLALTFAVFALGISPILMSMAGAPGPVASFYRMTIAVIVMSVPFINKWRVQRPLPVAGVWMAVLGGLFFALDMASWSTGVMLGSATNPTLLANTAPLWVGLGAMFFFKEKLSRGFWFGLLLSLGGAALVLGVTSAEAVDLGLGSLFGLLAAVFYGGYFLFVQRGRQHLSAFVFFWISAVVSMLGLIAIVLILDQPFGGYSTKTWILFVLMGVLPQAGGYMAITYASGHLPASLVSPTLLGQPVVTAILAGLFLGEEFTLLHLGGGVLVLSGVWLVHRSRG